MTDDLDPTEIEAAADKLVEAALDGNPEALKELHQSSALDDLDDEAEEGSEDDSEKRPELKVVRLEGESDAKTLARYALRPTMHAALSALDYIKWAPIELDINELATTLDDQVRAVKGGDLKGADEMLVAQAHTLDSIFNNLARRALRSELLNQFETHLKLALRAQSQCRSTWEAISAIHNPPIAGYVKQANIAHGHQQVNNASRAEENKTAPSKLLEETAHEPDQWLDRGTPTTAERANTAVETVGEIDGTTNAGGEG